MIRSKALRAGLVALGAVTLAAGAHAQAAKDSGGYLLLGGGRSSWDIDCSGTTACDKSGNAFQLIGGYKFGGGWAAEGIVADFGKTSARDNIGSVSLKARTIGAGVALAGNFSPDFGGTLRLGIGSVRTSGTARVGAATGSVSESKANLYAGIAVHYNFGSNAYAELGYLTTKGELEGDSGNLGNFTVSIGFRF